MPHSSSLHKPPGDKCSQASTAIKQQLVLAKLGGGGGGGSCMHADPPQAKHCFSFKKERKKESQVTCSFHGSMFQKEQNDLLWE